MKFKVPPDVRSVPFEFRDNESTCEASEVEIKTGEFLFLEKQCDNFIVCLFVKFWRFCISDRNVDSESLSQAQKGD